MSREKNHVITHLCLQTVSEHNMLVISVLQMVVAVEGRSELHSRGLEMQRFQFYLLSSIA